MMEQDSVGSELGALRLAAEKRDWNGCRSSVGKLLLQLPPGRALEVVREQVARRLPAFERHQPGVVWPRAFIEAAGVEPSSTRDGLSWPEEDEFPGPGANNFIRAVEMLWQASHSAGEAQRRTEALVDALAGAIMTEMVEAWGARHPEEWGRWYQESSSANYGIQRGMMSDPGTVSIERTAWLDVAGRLAEALGIKEPV